MDAGCCFLVIAITIRFPGPAYGTPSSAPIMADSLRALYPGQRSQVAGGTHRWFSRMATGTLTGTRTPWRSASTWPPAGGSNQLRGAEISSSSLQVAPAEAGAHARLGH